MHRSLLAASLAFAGVFVLAGAGWALVAGAFLVFALWRREPDWAVLAARVKAWAAGLATRAVAVPRRVTAVGGMAAGLLLVPAGLGLWAGAWAGLAAAGALFIGLSLLAGQGA